MAYASKYYDPVKRHEYYMKHRKLKGRRKRMSTAWLNEDGKIAAKEVKEGIMAEKKEFLKKLSDAMKAKIKNLRNQLKGLPKEEIQRRVQELRDAYKEHKAKVKEYYDEKYAQELDKIREDKSMLSTGRRRRR